MAVKMTSFRTDNVATLFYLFVCVSNKHITIVINKKDFFQDTQESYKVFDKIQKQNLYLLKYKVKLLCGGEKFVKNLKTLQQLSY